MIRVDPPSGDARRDRVERAVFDALDRGIARPEPAASPARSRRMLWFGGALAAAAAVLVVLLARPRGGGDERIASVPSRVVTPVGGASRFTIDDSVIDVGSDTSLEVSTGDGIALVLARGTVDCSVTPRGEREPFRVIAGDVIVEVVGTRFTVTRTPSSTRVDVTHGTVRVRGPHGETLVTAGERWSNDTTTASAPPPPRSQPEPEPTEPAEIEMPADETARRLNASKVAYHAAQKLLGTDPDGAARHYRKASESSDRYAALALFALADLEHERGHFDEALRTTDEYLKRFVRGANVEDVLWLRVGIHRSIRRPAAVRAAAEEYLQRFPAGTYALDAKRLVTP